MEKRTALRLLKDINMKFELDEEFTEEEFFTLLCNYTQLED